jgi:hypothetical protein
LAAAFFFDAMALPRVGGRVAQDIGWGMAPVLFSAQ